MLNAVGIQHNDPRTANFVIQESSNRAIVLDFGFSQVFDKKVKPEYLLDDKSRSTSVYLFINV